MWSTLRREGVVWSLLVATGSSVAYAYPYAGVQLREFESVGTVVDVRGTCPAVVFSVNGSTVATDTETDFDDLECSDILDGLRVEVEGVTQSDGRVLATEVESASESEDDEEDRDDDQDEDNETEHREAPPSSTDSPSSPSSSSRSNDCVPTTPLRKTSPGCTVVSPVP